jgi:ABC-type nitrate/sulfonate/bicarbonate transport system substrate-binding protein
MIKPDTRLLRCVILIAWLVGFFNDGTVALAAEKIRIAYGYRSNTALPLWAAIDARYFHKHGLDVEVINVRGSAIGIAGLVSGDFNYFVMGATSPVGAAGQGMDIVTPMTMTTPNFVLIGRPEIRQPSDLKGKTVAMGDIGGINDFAVAEGLKKFAVGTDQYARRIIGDQPSRVNGMLAGQFDATLVSPPVNLMLEKKGFKRLFATSDLKIPIPPAGFWVFRPALKKNPEMTEKIIKAMIEATKRVKEDKDLSYRLMKKYMRVDDLEVLEESYVSALPTFPERAPYVSSEALEQLIELIASRNPKIRALSPKSIIDHSAVKKIESEGFIDQLYKR